MVGVGGSIQKGAHLEHLYGCNVHQVIFCRWAFFLLVWQILWHPFNERTPMFFQSMMVVCFEPNNLINDVKTLLTKLRI